MFINDWGRPQEIVADGASEQIGSKTRFKKICSTEGIHIRFSEPYTPKQNPAEKPIGELRKKWYRLCLKKNPHPRVWDFGIKWTAQIMQRTAYEDAFGKFITPLE